MTPGHDQEQRLHHKPGIFSPPVGPSNLLHPLFEEETRERRRLVCLQSIDVEERVGIQECQAEVFELAAAPEELTHHESLGRVRRAAERDPSYLDHLRIRMGFCLAVHTCGESPGRVMS
jgi:hypothetical protein